jgi:hypothetical protein
MITTICVPNPIPLFTDVYNLFLPLLSLKLPSFTFPSLPTLPFPLYLNINCPSIQAVMIAAELQCTQLLNLIYAIIQPVVNYLGIAIADILPNIPGLGINLIQLLEGNVAQFIAQLESFSISTLLALAGIPAELYDKLVVPAFSAVHAFQLLVRSYFAALLNTLVSLINRISAFSLPTIPDFATFFAAVLSAIPNFSFNVNIPNLQNLLALVTIPGFAFLSLLPNPLYPNLSIPEFELIELLKNLYTDFITAPLTLILNFIQNILSITIPTICVPVTT